MDQVLNKGGIGHTVVGTRTGTNFGTHLGRHAVWAAALAGGLALSGCQSGSLNGGLPQNAGTTPPPATTAPPVVEAALSPVDGFWEPTTGGVTYKTQFKGGQFITRSNEGGLILAKGTYSTSPEGRVQLQWVSGAYKETVTADCNRPTPDTLICTPSRGSQLSLRRSAASS